jgi:hypothetical protein
MRISLRCLLLLCCLLMLLPVLGGLAAAQEKSDMHQPPKVLVITREFLKPYRGGAGHEKTEAAFVKAFADAKWNTHYLALDSLSGRPRSLFLTGYDSFEAWEKDGKAVEKNAALSAALGRAGLTDGDLLSDVDGGTFVYREDYSLRAPVDIPHMRYFEIEAFRTRPGHAREWDEAVKLVKAAYEKLPDVHWAMYQNMYGSAGRGTYLVFTPMKSAAEIDQSFTQRKDFIQAMGEDGMKKLGELEASAVESIESNMFSFNPRMSYVSEEFVKADPDFWKPKKTGAVAAAPAKKPAETAAKQ